MKTVLILAIRPIVSFAVALACSAEARAAVIGHEPVPVIALAHKVTDSPIVRFDVPRISARR
jgi:hypothetical protein